jgi:hypothetical protein
MFVTLQMFFNIHLKEKKTYSSKISQNYQTKL